MIDPGRPINGASVIQIAVYTGEQGPDAQSICVEPRAMPLRMRNSPAPAWRRMSAGLL